MSGQASPSAYPIPVRRAEGSASALGDGGEGQAPGSHRGQPSPWRLAGIVFLFFACLYASTTGAIGYSVDGQFSYRVARDMAKRGVVAAFEKERDLLRRWGPGLPLIGAPFVWIGERIARAMPPMDSLVLADLPGETSPYLVLLVDEPPISRDRVNAPLDQSSLTLPIPAGTGQITALTLVSYLSFARDVPTGTPIATATFLDGDQRPVGEGMPIRVGVDTSEWAYDDPVQGPPLHSRANVAGMWTGNPDAGIYRMTAQVAQPLPIAPDENALRSALPTPERREALGRDARGPDAPRLSDPSSNQAGRATEQRELQSGAMARGGVVASSIRFDAINGTGRLHLRAVLVSGERGTSAVTEVTSGSSDETADWVTRAAFGFANVIPGAATVGLLIPIAAWYRASRRTALTLAMIFGGATLAWPYARFDFSETLAGAFATGAFAARISSIEAITTRRAVVFNLIAALAAVGAGITKYTALWFIGLIAIDAIVHPGRIPRTVTAVAIGLTAALVGIVALAGGVSAPILITQLWDGLMRGWLGFPLWAGLASLVLSSGKGLVWFAPPVLLAGAGAVSFVRSHRLRAWIPITVTLMYLATFGSKGGWHGGGWGPRYLVPMVPFLMLLSLPVIGAAVGKRSACTSEALGWGGSQSVPRSDERGETRVWRRLARWGTIMTALAGLAIQTEVVLKHPNAYSIMFRDHISPELDDYGIAIGGTLASTYADYYRIEKARSELVSPPGAPTDIHGNPLPQRGLGHVIDRDSPMVLKLWPERTARFRLTVYVCNYDGLPEGDRFQNMTVVDASDTQSVMVTDFARGEYITWTVDSRVGDPVTLLAYDSGSAFPVISALFFDPDTETSGPVSPIVDRSTGGDWVGRYGRDGSLLFAWEMGPRDIGKLPPYINAVTGGERVWVDTGEAERSEIAMLYAPGFSPLLAHAWLLGNDLIHYLRPADAALQQRALASPPWRYVHGLEVHSPHPEYGLGIDLWPLAARQMFASHAGVMSAVWVLEGLFLTGLAIAAGMVVRAWKQSGPTNPIASEPELGSDVRLPHLQTETDSAIPHHP